MNFKKAYKLPQTGKDILYSLYIGRRKLARFLTALKDFGMEVRYRMNVANDTSSNQFFVACVVSAEEIGDETHFIIENSENYFMSMPSINVSKGYFTAGRITVLMNVPYWHGEARLLDPTGELWGKVTDSDIQDNIQEKRGSFNNTSNNILKDLKRRFQNEHGSSKRSVLIIHSHLIPCTNPRHECAELIAAFAEKTDDIIIVSYDVTYQDTDTKKSLKSLTACNNIYLCHPYEFRPYMNEEVYGMKKYFDQQGESKNGSRKWNIESDTRNRWTDTDQEFFPTMERVDRRTKYNGTKVTERLFKGRPISSKPKKEKSEEENHATLFYESDDR